jgi:hypothetical protein
MTKEEEARQKASVTTKKAPMMGEEFVTEDDDEQWKVNGVRPEEDDDQHHDVHSCAANLSKSLARNPCSFFFLAFLSSVAVSVVGFIVGDFTVSVDNTGWISRGTIIADQTTQILLLNRVDDILNDNDALWTDLTTNVQDGFEDASADEEEEDETSAEENVAGDNKEQRRRRRRLTASTAIRQLESAVPTGFLGCEATSLYVR